MEDEIQFKSVDNKKEKKEKIESNMRRSNAPSGI